MKFSKSSVIKVSKDSVHCAFEDEVVILEMNDAIYYCLNPVGAFIWNSIKKPKSVNEIHIAIVEEFDVGVEESEDDLIKLLNDLFDKGLIDVINENNS